MLKTHGRRVIILKDVIASFDDMQLHEHILKLKDSLIDVYCNESDWEDNLENVLPELEVFGNAWANAEKSTCKNSFWFD
jgi:hypothetical protein